MVPRPPRLALQRLLVRLSNLLQGFQLDDLGARSCHAGAQVHLRWWGDGMSARVHRGYAWHTVQAMLDLF